MQADFELAPGSKGGLPCGLGGGGNPGLLARAAGGKAALIAMGFVKCFPARIKVFGLLCGCGVFFVEGGPLSWSVNIFMARAETVKSVRRMNIFMARAETVKSIKS